MKTLFKGFVLAIAFVATFTVGYIKGMDVPQTVVDDYTIMETYVSEEFGESYMAKLNDKDVTDNECGFDVYTASGTYLTSISTPRYAM